MSEIGYCEDTRCPEPEDLDGPTATNRIGDEWYCDDHVGDHVEQVEPLDDAEAEYGAASVAYHAATRRLEAALVPYIATKVRAVYPEATGLNTYGEHSYDSGLILRVKAIWMGDDHLTENPDDEGWEAVEESVNDLLDQLIDLDEDGFLGDKRIDFPRSRTDARVSPIRVDLSA